MSDRTHPDSGNVDPIWLARFRADLDNTNLSLAAASLNDIAQLVHTDAVKNGWWDAERNDGELIALTHSELSEALEGLRHGNPPSEHTPQFTAVEEDMADVIIRVLDHCAARGWSIGSAVAAKILYNRGRGYKHGGKAF